MKLPVEKEPPCAVVALGVVATDASGSPGTPCRMVLLELAIIVIDKTGDTGAGFSRP